jgi:hypothetical protein
MRLQHHLEPEYFCCRQSIERTGKPLEYLRLTGHELENEYYQQYMPSVIAQREFFTLEQHAAFLMCTRASDCRGLSLYRNAKASGSCMHAVDVYFHGLIISR